MAANLYDLKGVMSDSRQKTLFELFQNALAGLCVLLTVLEDCVVDYWEVIL